MYNYSQYFDQYQNWLKQMQQMQNTGGGFAPFAGMPFGNFGNSAGAPFTSFAPNQGQQPYQQFQPLPQVFELFKQAMQSWQNVPWAHMFPTFDPTDTSAPNLRWPFGINNLADSSFFSSNIQMMGNKLQRMQEISLQIQRLLASAAKPEEIRSELIQLCRQLSSTLAEEINYITGNFFTVQFINNVRAGMGMQRRVLEEHMVHSALTPHHNDVEGYIQTCRLWQDVCESSLNMIDLYQQFTENFGEYFADSFISKIDSKDFRPQSAEQVMDVFVQLYEQQFVELLRSDNFSATYGDLVNRIVAVRADQQKYIDKTVEAFGLPSKREMDSTHERLRENRKDLRRIKRQLSDFDAEANKKIAQQLAGLTDQLSMVQSQLNEQFKHQSGQQQRLDALEQKVDANAGAIKTIAGHTNQLALLQSRLEELTKHQALQQQRLDSLQQKVDTQTATASATVATPTSPTQPAAAAKPQVATATPKAVEAGTNKPAATKAVPSQKAATPTGAQPGTADNKAATTAGAKEPTAATPLTKPPA